MKRKPKGLYKPCYHCDGKGCDKCDQTGWLHLSQFEIREDVARLIEYGQQLREEKGVGKPEYSIEIGMWATTGMKPGESVPEMLPAFIWSKRYSNPKDAIEAGIKFLLGELDVLA